MTLTLALPVLLVLCLVLWDRLNGLRREVRGLRERLERLERQAPARRMEGAWAPDRQGGPDPAREELARREPPEQGLWGTESAPPAPPSPQGPWPEDPPAATQEPVPTPLRAPLSSRTVFAALGAAVTLAGAAWFTAALARSGVLTREVQLGLAALLALTLYAGAGRAAPVIGEALRGLGYGILALCLGALVGAGVAPAGVVLAMILALSLAVGLHGAVQGRVLGTLTALAGASAATWIMADNLGDPLFPQLALLGILGCTALAERRLSAGGRASREPGDGPEVLNSGAGLLALLPGVSLLGLVVTAAVHSQAGHPLLWAALLLAAVGAALATGLRAGALEDRAATRLPPHPVLGAAGILLAGLAGSAPLLAPLGSGRGLGEGLSTAALLLVGVVCAGGAAALHRRPAAAGDGRGLLRDALLGVGVGTLGGALALGVDGPRLSTRLLGLATGTALLGGWLRSPAWRSLGAASVALLLLDHLLRPWPSSALVAGLGMGAGVALAGRAGAGVAGVAGATLAASVTVLPGSRAGWAVLDPGFGLAFLAALALHGGALALARAGQVPRARTLAWAAVAASALLVPLALSLAGSPAQAAVHGLLAGALLFLGPGGRQAGEALRGGPRRLVVSLELLGVASAALGLLAWGLDEGLGGTTFAALGLALAALAALVTRLPGQSRWSWRAWPLLGLAALVSGGAMLGGPGTVGEGVLTLLGAGATLAALWVLTTPAGLRRLPAFSSPRQRRITAQAVRRTGDPLWRDALLPALGLTLLALMGRTAELLLRGADAGLPLASTLTSTAALLVASVGLLVLARRWARPLLWWTALLAFGLAAGKLVFVDLDDLGGAARGAATILIGLLLLGIGQLAPRPQEPPAAGGPAGPGSADRPVGERPPAG